MQQPFLSQLFIYHFSSVCNLAGALSCMHTDETSQGLFYESACHYHFEQKKPSWI